MGRMTFYAHTRRDSGQDGWQSLEAHLEEVAAISSRLARKIGLPCSGKMIGLAHDLGKYSQEFQRYLQQNANNAAMEMEPKLAKGSVDHSTAGAQTISDGFARSGLAAEVLALCVASHHSGLIDCIEPNGEDGLARRLKKDDGTSHRNEALRVAAPSILRALDTLLNGPEVAAEIATAMQRIQDADADEVIQPFKQGLLLRMLFSCLIDADRTNTADFDKPGGALLRQHGEYAAWSQLIERLEQRLASFPCQRKIDQQRRKIAEHCLATSERHRGIFTLTVPTGGGKTLASLRFALHHAQRWQMDRVIYVSPYISIADQNAQVVREVLEPAGCDFASIVLEHHSNLTPDKESWRASVLAENWDAPVVFTTAVQVLDALFGDGTRCVRRLHALANAVIVFDEVQTLPVRMIHLFNNAINFLVEQCGASVVLCTATQPLLAQVDKSKGAIRLKDNAELMPNAAQLFIDFKRVEAFDKTTKLGGWNAIEVSELAVNEMLAHGSCLVIVNTKRNAREIYQASKERLKALDELMDEGYLLHLSTHMCPAHRLETLNKMKDALKAHKRVLCVSTQLIEAGVDIDFATVVRDLAGLDSITQAAGRCNRNGERTIGRVHIVKMAGSLPTQLDEIRCAQQNTRRVLDDWRAVNGDKSFPLSDPEQMRKFFQYHFFERRDQMDYPVKAQKNQRGDTLLRMLGENYLAVDDAQHVGLARNGFMQSFASAAKAFRVIDSPTQGVIVPFGEQGNKLLGELSAAYNLAKEFQLLKKAQQFSVNVFPWEMEALARNGAICEVQKGSGMIRLLDGYYSDEFGLALDGSGRMESMIA